MAPKNRPPSGRTGKGTEKVASAAIICTPGEAPGKKTAKCVGDKAVYAEVEPLHRVARAAAVIAFLSLLSSMMVMSLMCIGLCRFS